MKNAKKFFYTALLSLILILSCLLFWADAAIRGDVNADGTVSADDARLVLRCAVELEVLSDAQKTVADIDGNGKITASDARIILRTAVGLEISSETRTDNYNNESVITHSTCTEKGIKKLYCECGEFRTEELPLTDHKAVTDKAVPATCTVQGKTEGSHCSVCGTVLVKQQTINAARHKEIINKEVPATCTESGLTEGKLCSVCNTVIV